MFGSTCEKEARMYDRMNAINHDALQSENKLLVDTRFQGTRLKPLLRGSIGNISLDNFTPQQFVAGFLDGSVEELYGFYEKIPLRIRKKKRAMAGSGNGIRENKLLRRIFERRFGFTLRVPRFKEEAAVGAALCAATGAGVYADIFLAAEKFHARNEG
jgi:sedoheptulokinase